MGAYLELILPLFGTRFISDNDGFDSANYIGTTGGLELALHNLINNMYSKDLSVKIRSSIKTRNKRGQYWGGQAFYGYKLHPDVWQSVGYGDKNVTFALSTGDRSDMPANCVISLDKAIECAKQFYDILDKPRCIEWRKL